MRTTINIDEQALAEAMRVAEGLSKSDVVNEALRRFARARRRLQLLSLRGTLQWEGDLDALRRRS